MAFEYAQFFSDHGHKAIGQLSADGWHTLVKKEFPAVQFISARVAMSNEVHVNQLLVVMRTQKGAN